MTDAELLTMWRACNGPLAKLNGPLIRFAGMVEKCAVARECESLTISDLASVLTAIYEDGRVDLRVCDRVAALLPMPEPSTTSKDVEVCLGCGTQTAARDCGCPAGTAMVRQVAPVSTNQKAWNVRVFDDHHQGGSPLGIVYAATEGEAMSLAQSQWDVHGDADIVVALAQSQPDGTPTP